MRIERAMRMTTPMAASRTGPVVAAFAVLALIAGCASGPPAAQVETLLTAAGFKTAVASTDKQLRQIPTLPAGQVTVVTQTGKNWFLYPDLARNRVYVGTEKEYRAYLKLRAQNNLPQVEPMASYYGQDAAMSAASAYAAPPVTPLAWEGWPEFGALGWQ
jgi:hypothetical protein